jgi:hypothetical protein
VGQEGKSSEIRTDIRMEGELQTKTKKIQKMGFTAAARAWRIFRWTILGSSPANVLVLNPVPPGSVRFRYRQLLRMMARDTEACVVFREGNHSLCSLSPSLSTLCLSFCLYVRRLPCTYDVQYVVAVLLLHDAAARFPGQCRRLMLSDWDARALCERMHDACDEASNFE